MIESCESHRLLLQVGGTAELKNWIPLDQKKVGEVTL